MSVEKSIDLTATGATVEEAVAEAVHRASLTLRGVTGFGPPADVLELAEWAAWRWAGRPAHFLRTASPPGAVKVASG